MNCSGDMTRRVTAAWWLSTSGASGSDCARPEKNIIWKRYGGLVIDGLDKKKKFPENDAKGFRKAFSEMAHSILYAHTDRAGAFRDLPDWLCGQ